MEGAAGGAIIPGGAVLYYGSYRDEPPLGRGSPVNIVSRRGGAHNMKSRRCLVIQSEVPILAEILHGMNILFHQYILCVASCAPPYEIFV